MPNKTEQPAPAKKKHFQFFRNMIVTGLLVAVPVILSLWVARYVYSRLTGWGLTLADSLGRGGRNRAAEPCEYKKRFFQRLLIYND